MSFDLGTFYELQANNYKGIDQKLKTIDFIIDNINNTNSLEEVDRLKFEKAIQSIPELVRDIISIQEVNNRKGVESMIDSIASIHKSIKDITGRDCEINLK